ncbi:MAG: hypothetical protein ACM3ML_15720 [Micromonosporaceae bacterium]
MTPARGDEEARPVEVMVLTVPGCPHAALAEERLATAIAGLAGVHVIHRVVADEQDAVVLGMRGSPTILIDGSDPFASPAEGPSLSCRLYRQADGSLAGAPAAEALREAITR